MWADKDKMTLGGTGREEMAGNGDTRNTGSETCPVLAGGSSLAGEPGESNSSVMDMLSAMMSEMRKNTENMNQLKEAVCQGLVESKEEVWRYTDMMCVSLKQELSVEVVTQEEVRACQEELATL